MKEKETILFGGGCFWCVEAVFLIISGVLNVESGYAGGSLKNPTYEEVSKGNTGHAEVVKIEYDSQKVNFRKLLDLFFELHDPTTLNRQGSDIGTQYRSIILYTLDFQKKEALKYIKELKKSQAFSAKKIITEVSKLDKFWPAEKYHQRYYESHKDAPYSKAIIEPKVEKIKDKLKLDK